MPGRLASLTVAIVLITLGGPAATAAAEEKTVTGTLQILHMDLKDGGTREVPQVVVGEKRYDLQDADLDAIAPGSTVRVSGNLENREIEVDSLSVTAAPKPPKSATTVRVLAILLYSESTGPDAVTPAMVEEQLEVRDSAWFRSVSKGHVEAVTADATEWIPVPATQCGWDTGPAAAAAAGYDLSKYDRHLVYFPHDPACPSGAAIIGDIVTAINGSENLGNGITVHELGHNHGLWHANRISCSAGPVLLPLPPIGFRSGCSHLEYGDQHDVMGSSIWAPPAGSRGSGHYGAYHLDQLGWLAGRVTDVPRAGGKYELKPIEATDRGLQAVRLHDGERTYWIYYRQPIGVDAFLAPSPQATDGLVIQVDAAAMFGSYDGSEVLDMTPDGDFFDVTLDGGRSWTTPNGAFRVDVSAVGSKAATFRITAPLCLVQNSRTRAGFTRLQEAHDAASSGDTLTIKGTCARATLLKDVTLRGVVAKGYDAPALTAPGRWLETGSAATIAINDLAITGGTGGGGGVFNRGTLTLNNVTVSGNNAVVGGGIVNVGTMALNDSRVSGNHAYDTGGGILNAGALTLHDSTVSDNSAAVAGGGIYTIIDPDSPNSLTLTGTSSVSGNTPDEYAEGPDLSE